MTEALDISLADALKMGADRLESAVLPPPPPARPTPGGVARVDPAALLAKAAEARATEQELALQIAREPLLRRSDSIAKLTAALAKAQGEITNANKSAENPFFKTKYADLGAVMDACRGPLSKYGLAVFQPASSIGKTVIVTTLLACEDEWIEDKLILTAAQDTPQAVGSAITYGRRYALSSMVGVAAGDDDGEAATRSLPPGVKHDTAKGKLQESTGSPETQSSAAEQTSPGAPPSPENPGSPSPTAATGSGAPLRPAARPAARTITVQKGEEGQPQTVGAPPPPGMRPPARVPGR